jgi:hypothetical protein
MLLKRSLFHPLKREWPLFQDEADVTSRSACLIQSSQSNKDDEDSGIDENKMLDPAIDVEDIDKTKQYFKSCRQCELACPVGS